MRSAVVAADFFLSLAIVYVVMQYMASLHLTTQVVKFFMAI